jgi:DNA-directed RNA polymerase specialized sigma24 family protein
MDAVIEFKREVYQRALNELARYLRRHACRRFGGREEDDILDASALERG